MYGSVFKGTNGEPCRQDCSVCTNTGCENNTSEEEEEEE